MRNVKQTFGKLLTVILLAALLPGCSREAKKAGYLKRANGYFKSAEYEKAKIEYFNVLRLEPLNRTAIKQMGLIYQEQGVPTQAFRFLYKAKELAPEDSEIRIKLGYVYMAGGQKANAREEAITVLSKDPLNGEAMLLLVDASATRTQVTDAEQRLERIRQPAGGKADYHLAQSSLSFRSGDVRTGESELRQALALDPKSVVGHLTLAGIFRSRSNLVEAEKEFKTAAELAPLRSLARLRYAEFKIANGKTAEAKKDLNAITAKAADYLPAWKLLAQIAFTEKNYDECIAANERILRLDQASYMTRQLLAQVWLAKGQTAKAVQELEILNLIYTNMPQARYELAMAYLQNTNQARALASLEQAIRLNTNYTEAILLQARINLRQGDAATVVTSMVNLLKRRPNTPPAYLLLADAYRQMKRFEEAANIFRGLAKSNPQEPQLFYFLGAILREQGKNAEAREAFEKALALKPEDPLALYQLVDIDILNKNSQLSLMRLQDLMKKNPNSANLKFLEGRIYSARSEWDQAEATLLKTVELDPNYLSAYHLLVRVYVAAKKLPQASRQNEAILTKKPQDPMALMLSGAIYNELKDYAKARQAYEKLLRIQPRSGSVLNNLAYMCSEHLNLLDEAHGYARRARDVAPEDSGVADTLGWILYKRGDYAGALTLLEESAGQLASNSEVQFHLAMTWYMMGEPAQAKIAFQRALASPETFPGREEAQRRLALLDYDPAKPAVNAVADLEKILKDHPTDVVARMRLGEHYEKQGAADKAAREYEQILKLNSQNFLATLRLAQVNAGPLQNTNKAFALAKKARDLAPADPAAALLLGRLAYQSGDFQLSYSLLRESAAKHTNAAGANYDFGWAAYSIGRIAEAEQAMQRALAIDPQFAQASGAKWFLAMTALQEKPANSVQAEPQAAQILKSDPNHVPALMVLGQIHLQRGETRDASQAYEKVLGRYPKFAPAQKHLAALYSQQPGMENRAYELATSAREKLPADPELAKTLGRITYSRKDYQYAVRVLEEALRSNASDAEALYLLGLSQYQLKANAQSKAALQKAILLDPKAKFAEEAKKILSELK